MDDTKRIISKSILTNTANAIRTKKGTSNTMTPSDFADEIASIETQKPTQTKIAYPSTSEQIVSPDEGYELSSVTVKPVTSSIDSNIKPQNIKKDISILGVTGTYTDNNVTQSIMSNRLPSARNRAGAVVHGNIIYIFGGIDSNNNATDTIFKYDIENKTISTSSAQLPIAASDIFAVSFNNRIYIFTGNQSNTLYIFDPYAETFSTITNPSLMGIKQIDYGFIYNNKVTIISTDINGTGINQFFIYETHIMGSGSTKFYNTPTCFNVFNYNVFKYYSETNNKVYTTFDGGTKWTIKTTTKNYSTNAKSLELGGKTILLGGYSSNQLSSDLTRVTIVDWQPFNITQLTGSKPLNSTTSVTYGSKIYSIGGLETINGQDVPSDKIIETTISTY